jgi:pyruvate,water dikinase
MLVEAAWGLGELIVSGRVSPDRFHIDRDTGAAVEQQLGDKPIRMSSAGIEDVAPELRKAACLDADQLRVLADAGRQIEAYYQSPRDVEWAWQGGRLWILQARPVTTAGAYERAQVREAEMARLRASAAETGTVWARYNISEVLPTATPMTWAIVREFMSGRGGYGMMFRDLGYDPDPIIDREGFIDLICGRPYINLSREPKQYYRDFPYGHKFEELKANPDKALYPQPEVDPAAATARFWLRSPWIIYRMFRTGSRIRAQMATAADRLRREVFPEFARATVEARRKDLTKLDNAQLLAGLNEWTDRTLQQFARESLKPSMFAAVSISNLEADLGQKMGFEEARVAVRQVLTGVHPDPEADLGSALRALSQGAMDRPEFLARFGWRGSHEMELAQPRWEEASGNLPAAEKSGPAAEESHQPTPAERWDELFSKPPLSLAQQPALAAEFENATSYLALRESAKHHLMLGYSLIRRHLLELDRRLGLGGGIFFLVPAELPSLVESGQASPEVLDLIARRRREHQAALSLELPPVLFSDDLEAIGRTAPLLEGQGLQGVAVSAGMAEGPALVLTDPGEAPADCRDFVLVCPSTDPAWVPLFLKARALVMETGGVLSHGAIVAREFGLPAVVGIPQVHRQLRTGQPLRVDGNTGAVHLIESGAKSPG